MFSAIILSALIGVSSTETLATPSLPEVHSIGSGPTTLLLIPCMSGRWVQWQPFMERNKDRFTCIAVTLPGFGGTRYTEFPLQSPERPWREHALEGLETLLEKRNIEDVVLVGHSWGTTIALELASRQEQRVRAVINVDGFLTNSREAELRTDESRAERSARVVDKQVPRFDDPDEWRKFNWVRFDDPERSQLYHGMFMATNRTALVGYWSENPYLRLNEMIRELDRPILNIEVTPRSSTRSEDVAAARRAELDELRLSERMTTVFAHRTSHFVMEHRPRVLDRMIADFLAGHTPEDYSD